MRVYCFPTATMASSPPSTLIILSGMSAPATMNTLLKITAHITALKKYPSADLSFLLRATTNLIAEPTPIIAPIANIRLYRGSTRLSAVMPSAPTAFDIKKVSARI